MHICPRTIVIRTAPVPPSLRRTRNSAGLIDHGQYEVAAVLDDMIRLKDTPGWHSARRFNVLLQEPCA
jgi:hypothetical protein